MPNIALEEPRPLPRWLKVLASLGILAHFLAIGGLVLSAPSGPWFPGAPPIRGPQFAMPIEEAATPYLTALRMTHTYHFSVDRPRPAVYLEVNLRDARGSQVKTLRIPDPKAVYWVRHRQQLLADSLFEDRPLPQQEGEVIAPTLKQTPTQKIWEPVGKEFVIKTVAQHEVPRNRGVVLTPSDWSLLVVQAYARHLCRVHGAASAEIVRHSRDIVLPPTLLPPPPPGQQFADPPPALFEELVYNFGVHRGEE